MAKKTEISDREKLFCLEYVKDFNGTQSYLKVWTDITYDTARDAAPKLLAKPCVKAEIDRLKAIRCKAVQIDANYVLERLKQIDELDVADLFDDAWQLLPVKQWPKSWRTSISGLDVISAKNGDVESIIKKLKFPDKVKNLELIGRHVSIKAWDKETAAPTDDIAKAISNAIEALPN